MIRRSDDSMRPATKHHRLDTELAAMETRLAGFNQQIAQLEAQRQACKPRYHGNQG